MNIHVTAKEPSFAEVLYKVVLTLDCGLNLVREIKTTEQNCGAVSFALLFFLTSGSVSKMLKCDHSNESS